MAGGIEAARRKELLQQISRGSAAAFDQFYHIYVNIIYGYLKTRIADEHFIKDVMQEAFVAIWKNAGTYRHENSVNAWVISIARYKLMDAFRAKYKLPQEEWDEDVLHVYEQEDISTQVIDKMHVDDAVNRLPSAARELLYMVFQAGLSYKEIAVLLAIPEGTVKSRMYTLKKQLVPLLEDRR